MDTQELENLQKSSSTKSQDAEEKTSEELERNLNLNEANNKGLREVELRRQRVAETSKLVGSMIGAFLGTMIYSKIYQEYEGETWTESLMNGFIAAVSLGFGFLLGKIITPTNEAVSTNLGIDMYSCITSSVRTYGSISTCPKVPAPKLLT